MSEGQYSSEPQRRRFRPYPKYKDSGMKLIGSIPIGWHIKPIFALYERRTQRKHKDLPLLSVYRDYGVIPREDREDNFNRPSPDLSPYQLVENRDLVLNKMKTWQGSIAVSELRGIVSPAYIICRPRHGEHDRYMHYLLRAPSYITQYASLSYGVRVDQWDLRFEDFRRIQVLLPPVEDQRAIAAFLDCETEKIDALIAKKERLIELLQEKRTTLITHAVTKGLDPNVPMKDSGVEWIEFIPAMWRVSPLFVVAREKEKKNIGNQVQNVLSLSYGKIIDKDVSDNFGLLPESFETYQIVIEGDIILRLTDLQNDKRSLRVGLVRHQGIITSAYICLNFYYGVNPLYAFYLLHAYDIIKVFYSLGGGVRQTMKFEDLKWLPILIPSLEEQGSIAAFLNRKTARIDSLGIKLREAIDHLKEYRTALISAAVTGKIDVRSESGRHQLSR